MSTVCRPGSQSVYSAMGTIDIMMKILSLMFLVLAICASTAVAGDHDMALEAVESGVYKPLSSILEKVSRGDNGRVLEVELERDKKGNAFYEIKLIDGKGQKSELRVNAVSGELMNKAGGTNGATAQRDVTLHPLPDILRKMLAQYPGLVTDVDLERDSGERPFYNIEIIMQDGRIRELKADAVSGTIITQSGRESKYPAGLMPLPDVLDRLGERYSGDIKEAELEHDRHGQYYYEIEIELPDGLEIELKLDAFTGELLKEER